MNKNTSKTLLTHQLELTKSGSVHGRIVYAWGVSPYCSTYYPEHTTWLLENGYDIIPEHNEGKCAGFICGHNEPTIIITKRNFE